jgi:hypothetical protein
LFKKKENLKLIDPNQKKKKTDKKKMKTEKHKDNSVWSIVLNSVSKYFNFEKNKKGLKSNAIGPSLSQFVTSTIHLSTQFDHWILQQPQLKQLVWINELGVRPTYLFLGVFILFFGMRVFGFALDMICNIFALLYPCYAAYKLLAKENLNYQIIKQENLVGLQYWLKYFLLFSVWVVVIDSGYRFLSAIFGFNDIIYFAIKTLVFILLYQKKTGLLELVFKKLTTWVQPHEPFVEDQLKTISQTRVGARFL